jgi:hypothetical protein
LSHSARQCFSIGGSSPCRGEEKLAAAPDMPAPGSRVPHKNANPGAKQEAQKKFEKTGKVEDAVALILS